MDGTRTTAVSPVSFLLLTAQRMQGREPNNARHVNPGTFHAHVIGRLNHLRRGRLALLHGPGLQSVQRERDMVHYLVELIRLQGKDFPSSTMANAVDQLAFKIELLSHINSQPVARSINASQRYERLAEGRVLRMKHEILLAEQLAFICGYSKKPGHIVAVCIEEAIAEDGVTIHLAANSGKHEELVDSLKKISSILQNEAIAGPFCHFRDLISHYQRVAQQQVARPTLTPYLRPL